MIKKTGETIKRPAMLQASPELVEIQALMPMDPADRERLKQDIRNNGIRDPLKIYTDKNGRALVLGGWSRLQIAQELGIDEIKADVYDGTPAERRELVINDNLNRRHLTAEQKRNLIRYFFKQDPRQSARTVAKKTGTDTKTVTAVRRDMESRVEIPHVKEIRGSDGKKYKRAAVEAPRRVESITSPRADKITQGKAEIISPIDIGARTAIEKFINKYTGRDRKKAKERLKRFIDGL